MVNKVLVIALHEQRPDQDGEVAHALTRSIASYRASLARMSGDEAFAEAPGLPGVGYYQPRAHLLLGTYDVATAYLADDLASVHHVASATGASSQDFLFGPVDDTADNLAGLQQLFAPAPADAAKPYLALCRLKVGDHLVAAGGEPLCRAIMARVRQALHDRGLPGVVTRCWSWPEIVTIIAGDDLLEVLDTANAIEALSVGDLDASALDDLRGSLAHPIPAEIFRAWAFGLGPRRHGATDTRPTDPRSILAAMAPGHLFVAPRTQLGLHASGWLRAAQAAGIPACLQQVMDAASSPAHASAVPSLAEVCQGLTEVCQHAGGHASTLTARIELRIRPGHEREVAALAHEVAGDALGAAVSREHRGDGPTVSVTYQVPADPRAHLVAGVLGAWFRVEPRANRHLIGVRTVIRSSVTTADADVPRTHQPDTGGFRLFSPERRRPDDPPDAPSDTVTNAIEFRAFQRRQLSRVERMHLTQLRSAVVHTLARPSMVGSMLALDEVMGSILRAALVAPDDGPLSSRLAAGVRDLVAAGQIAYQQRLQLTSAVAGAPPISAALPYGIHQLVMMVDAIVAAAFAPANLVQPDHHGGAGDAADAPIVTFTNNAISVRTILGVPVVRLSLVQALSPMSLSGIFHELGHQLIATAGGLERAQARRETFHRAVTAATTDPRSRSRYADFIEDIFGHSAWRRLMCGPGRDGYRRFRRLFLTCAAMGLRADSDLRATSSLQFWAEVCAHLLVQTAVVEANEEPGRALASLARLDMAVAKPVIASAWRYFADEATRDLIGDDEIYPTDLAVARVCHVFERLYLKPLRQLAEASRVHRALDELAEHLKPLEDSLTGATTRLSWDVNEPGRRFSDDLSALHGALTAKTTLPSPGWANVLDARGRPDWGALVWIRTLLQSVNDGFESSPRANHPRGNQARSVPRDADLRVLSSVTHSASSTPLQGEHADCFGGVFVAGAKARRRYLGERVRVIGGLLDFSHRIQAGRFYRFLTHRRRYCRRPLVGAGEVARAPKAGTAPPAAVKVDLIDASPVGLALGWDPATAGPGLQAGDDILVRTVSGDWLEARVAVVRPHSTSDGGAEDAPVDLRDRPHVVGVVLLADDERAATERGWTWPWCVPGG